MAKGRGAPKNTHRGDGPAEHTAPQSHAQPDLQLAQTSAALPPGPVKLTPIEQLKIEPESVDHPSTTTVLAAFEHFKTGDYHTTRQLLAPILTEGSGAPPDIVRAAGFMISSMGLDPMTMVFAAVCFVGFIAIVALNY